MDRSLFVPAACEYTAFLFLSPLSISTTFGLLVVFHFSIFHTPNSKIRTPRDRGFLRVFFGFSIRLSHNKGIHHINVSLSSLVSSKSLAITDSCLATDSSWSGRDIGVYSHPYVQNTFQCPQQTCNGLSQGNFPL